MLVKILGAKYIKLQENISDFYVSISVFTVLKNNTRTLNIKKLQCLNGIFLAKLNSQSSRKRCCGGDNIMNMKTVRTKRAPRKVFNFSLNNRDTWQKNISTYTPSLCMRYPKSLAKSRKRQMFPGTQVATTPDITCIKTIGSRHGTFSLRTAIQAEI